MSRNLFVQAIYEVTHAVLESKSYAWMIASIGSFMGLLVSNWQVVPGVREAVYVAPFYLWTAAFIMVAGLIGRILGRYVFRTTSHKRPKILAWLIVNTLLWSGWLLFCMFAANTVYRFAGEIVREAIMGLGGMVPMIGAEFYQLCEYIFGEPDSARGYISRILRFSKAAFSLSRKDIDAALYDVLGEEEDEKGETPKE